MALERWTERAEAVESEVTALDLAARHPETPASAKAVVVLLVAYAVSPIDPIPDFLPGLGYLDEVLLLPVGATLAIRLVPEDVMAECRERADEDLDPGRAKWVVAGLVVLLWTLVAVVAWRALVRS